jgi:hypothetical protein
MTLRHPFSALFVAIVGAGLLHCTDDDTTTMPSGPADASSDGRGDEEECVGIQKTCPASPVQGAACAPKFRSCQGSTPYPCTYACPTSTATVEGTCAYGETLKLTTAPCPASDGGADADASADAPADG